MISAPIGFSGTTDRDGSSAGRLATFSLNFWIIAAPFVVPAQFIQYLKPLVDWERYVPSR